MARRSKKKSTLNLILDGNWKVSALFALLVFVLLFLIVPIINNPILTPVSLALRPLGLFAIGGLILISAFKFFVQSRTTNAIVPIHQNTIPFNINNPIERPQAKAQHDPVIVLPTEWTLKLIQEIEWKRFEELSTAYYLEKGIRAEATSLGADGGIDIKLYQDSTGKPTSLVQCKAWFGRQVGVKEIREFLGVLTHEKIAKGFYMTSSEFTEDAKATAKANHISLISGEMFLLMLQRLSEESRKKLLDLATAGDYKTPSCSACGVKMIRRKGDRSDFWGCSNFPKCRQRLNIRKSDL